MYAKFSRTEKCENTKIVSNNNIQWSTYIREVALYVKGNSHITMVAAKNIVNLLKNVMNVPKLELSTTHLLPKLMQKIRKALIS